MVFDLPGLAAHLDIALPKTGSARSPSRLKILGVNTLELATATDLCFAEQTGQADQVAASGAGAVLVSEQFPAIAGPQLIRLPEPRKSFFSIAECFVPAAAAPGVHASAQVDATARWRVMWPSAPAAWSTRTCTSARAA